MEDTMDLSVRQDKSIRIEDGLYLVALGLALLVRLILLGRLMLTAHEAGYAWQAYQVSQGQPVGIANHPAYVLLTGLLFIVFGSGEVLARLLPVLVGSAVILFPYLLRDQLGRKAALIAAFGLALDPLLIAFSRQAGSPMMALGFLALGWFFWQRSHTLAAGIFWGLMLLSGPSLVFGILVMLISWGLFSFVGGYRISLTLEKDQLRPVGIGVLVCLAAFGTLFMLYPEGLSFMLQAVPDYFVNWFGGGGGAQGVPLAQALLAFPIYQPLALLFGLLVFFERRNFNQPQLVFLMCAFLAALLLMLANPGRQIWMTVWALIPLWLLAGTVLDRFVHTPAQEDRLWVWGETVFYLVLLAYWWFNLSKLTTNYGLFFQSGVNLLDFASLDANTKVYAVRLLVTFLIPVLIVVMTFIVYRGWSQQASIQGVAWSVSIFLVFYLVTAGSGFTADLTQVASELWVEGPSSGYAAELMQAIEEASEQITGTQDQVDLVYQIDTPLVHWLLRNMPNASYQPVLNPNQLPSVIMNQSFELNGSLSEFYSGQHHALQLERFWDGRPVPQDFDRWLVYRDSPLVKDWVVLWTRVDLFPLYNSTQAE
jgi:hypothetical protein